MHVGSLDLCYEKRGVASTVAPFICVAQKCVLPIDGNKGSSCRCNEVRTCVIGLGFQKGLLGQWIKDMHSVVHTFIMFLKHTHMHTLPPPNSTFCSDQAMLHTFYLFFFKKMKDYPLTFLPIKLLQLWFYKFLIAAWNQPSAMQFQVFYFFFFLTFSKRVPLPLSPRPLAQEVSAFDRTSRAALGDPTLHKNRIYLSN